MSITIKKTNWNLPRSGFRNITIIPASYSAKDENEYYHDTTNTFYKFAKDKIDIDLYSCPDVCLVQRSIDWVAPVIYIGRLLFEISLTELGDVIFEYLKSKYLGKETTAKLEIITESSEKGKFMSIKYEGPSSEVKTALSKIHTALQSGEE
tara:strand:+ start:4000 stop:4452 length:453 start_codon:yes stop_codon:yes gene_type:complete